VRAVVPIALAVACGGSPPPPPKPVEPSPEPRAKRVPIEDTEPEDGVTIVNAHGHMEPAAVEAGIRPHADELTSCYMSKVGRRRWLGGHVQLHWDIKRDGTVTSVKLAESDLGAWPIERCLLEVARAATFDKPVGGDADFALPLDFSARGRTSDWDEDQTLKAVGGQLAKLDACGKTEPSPDDVTITLYVGPHGKALSSGFSSARTEITDKWAECADKVVKAWRLPDPRGQVAKLAIRYRR
jgi:hypothetical protein